jgi:hypothetical protein
MSEKLLKILFAFVILISLFSKFFDNIFETYIFGFLDELLLMFSVFMIMMQLFIRTTFNKFSWQLLLGLFVLLAISVLSKYFTKESIIQVFIHLKLFFYFLVLKMLFFNDNKLLRVTFFGFIIITFLGLFSNLILYDYFNTFFEIPIKSRFDLLRMNGVQLSANNLGISFLIMYLYFVFSSNKKGFLMVSVISFVFICLCLLSGTRTALLIVPFVYIVLLKDKYSGVIKYIGLFSIFLVVFSVMIILSDTEIIQKTITNITDINNDSMYARGIILFNSLKLASMHFPIGSGAATFGSILSVNSPVYSQLGINFSGFDKAGMTAIFDSNFASILAEFGVIGILVFSFLLYKMYKSINNNSSYYLLVLLSVIIFSFTNPTIMNGFQALLFALALNLNPNNLASK